MPRSREEAQAEVQRELHVRQRCYDRWVQEGRLTAIEARDRLDRLTAALHYLSTDVTSSGDMTAQPA